MAEAVLRRWAKRPRQQEQAIILRDRLPQGVFDAYSAAAHRGPERYIRSLCFCIPSTPERDIAKATEEFCGVVTNMFHAQEGCCCLSGVRLTWCHDGPDNISIDRIDSRGPYSRDNIRLVTVVVNRVLNNAGDAVFYEMLESIVAYRRARTAMGRNFGSVQPTAALQLHQGSLESEQQWARDIRMVLPPECVLPTQGRIIQRRNQWHRERHTDFRAYIRSLLYTARHTTPQRRDSALFAAACRVWREHEGCCSVSGKRLEWETPGSAVGWEALYTPSIVRVDASSPTPLSPDTLTVVCQWVSNALKRTTVEGLFQLAEVVLAHKKSKSP
jgi:hypothetical protein